jgi:uncharacterized protein (DUF2267 family)
VKNLETIEFYDLVLKEAGLRDREEAKKIAQAVLSTLASRLPVTEIDDLAAQLPVGLKELVTATHFEKMHFEEFLTKIKEKAGLPDLKVAEHFTRAVFKVLKGFVTQGEIKDVTSVLPDDLKELWQLFLFLSCFQVRILFVLSHSMAKLAVRILRFLSNIFSFSNCFLVIFFFLSSSSFFFCFFLGTIAPSSFLATPFMNALRNLSTFMRL